MTPKITVLMAVYNGAAYLKECMDSVLSQTYEDFEFLIIDDGSTDATRDIIRTYIDKRIRLIENNTNLSQVASLNIGLGYARGDYIARIDADDVMLSHRLKRQLDFLQSHSDLALVGSYGEAIDESGRGLGIARLPVRNEEIIINSLFCGTFVTIHSAFMFRKKPVIDVGRYNAAFSFTEDYKLALDLFLNRYKINNIPEVLVKYRIHRDRISMRSLKPQTERCIIACRGFLEKFTPDHSKEERDLLFEFLRSAGSLESDYWKDAASKDNIKKALSLCDTMLANIGSYFKFGTKANYFVRRIFYSKMLNFLYHGCFIKRGLSMQLYRHCLNNCLFVLTNPKLYIYPFILALPIAKKKND